MSKNYKSKNCASNLRRPDPVLNGITDAIRVLYKQMRVGYWLILRDVSLRTSLRKTRVYDSDDKSVRACYAIAARSAARRMGVHISSLEMAAAFIPSSEVEISAKIRILQRFDQMLCHTNAGVSSKVHTFDSLDDVRKFFLRTWKPGTGIGYKYDESTQRLTDAQQEWACDTWKKLTSAERVALRRTCAFPSALGGGALRGGGAASAEKYFEGMRISFTVAHYKCLKNFVYGYADENENNKNNKEEINK